MWFAYACMWLGVSAAVAFSVYWTGHAFCLSALLIPALVSFQTSCRKDDSDASDAGDDGSGDA